MPICESCGRETRGARPNCMYCGGKLIVETRAHLTCPRCNTGMRREVVDGLELDLCDSCGGTWYDRGELEQHITAEARPVAGDLAEGADAEFHREPDKMDTRYLLCPICDKPMTRKNWGRLSGIIVDVCGPHGLFLDAGELERIRDFEASGTKTRAEGLETWEQTSAAKDQRLDQSRSRQKFQREMAANRVRFWGMFG